MPAGQAGNYTAGTWTCDKNVSVSADNKINVPAGTTDVTCEITNTRKATSLKLKKIVSGGGTVPSDWTMTATGRPVHRRTPSRVTTARSSRSGPTPVHPVEIVPAGQAGNYTAGTWTCDKNVSVSADNKITVPAGTTDVTCEITNTRKATSLKLKKIVSGGGTVPGGLDVKATAPTGSPSYSKPGNHGSFEPISANPEYTLSETVPAGQANNYTAGTWTCDKNVTVTQQQDQRSRRAPPT